MNIEKAINEANKILNNSNIKFSELDSEILMSQAIKKDRKFIILNRQFKIEEGELNHFKGLIKQRSFGKPIAYLTGKKNFWKHEFEVNKDNCGTKSENDCCLKGENVIENFEI